MTRAMCLIVLLTTAVRIDAAQRPADPARRVVPTSGGYQAVFKALYSGDADAAVRLADARLKTNPSDVAMLVLAARAHLARNEHQAAYDLLERALGIDSGDADALYFMGIVSGELAARSFARVYALAPDGARVHQLMARSLWLQQNSVDAAAEYALALKTDPTLLDALLEFARLRREESNCEEAAALYERAQRVKPTHDGAYGFGVCLAMQGNHARAIEAFREALTYDPKSAAAEFGLGSSLLNLGDAPAAVESLERAARLAPNMRETFYVLGRAYQKLGQSERAQQAFERANALARAERGGGPPAKPPR
jgi:tetratricopeptide (TPR) repeat protein